MPALMLFLGCLAIVLVLAVPSAAPAAPAPGPAMVPGVGKLANYEWIKGTIDLSPSSQMIKFWNPECNAIIIEGRKAGGDPNAVPLATAHATPGAKSGECVYALKVPAGEALTIGVRAMSFHADSKDPGATQIGSATGGAGAGKVKAWDKTTPLLHGIYVKMPSTYAKLVPALDGEIVIKGTHKDIKLAPGQQATVPLFLDVTNKGSAGYI